MDRPDLARLVSQADHPALLRPLFTALGYRPVEEPDGDGWRTVARWDRYRVEAARATDPREAVRTRARQLAAAAEPALAVAVGTDELALAAPRIGPAGSSRVLAMARSDPDPVALDLLASLRPDAARGGTLAHALHVAERLASEEAGERFFTAFHAVLEGMTAALGDRGRPEECRLAALLTLTRVLFLYFVQARGWLDGRADYLRAQLDAALAAGRPFHRRVLHPLFFGTLNRAPAERTVGRHLGVIPYLNGGLFEPHPVERRLGPVTFENALWRDAFDGLFERFRFCVREAEEVGAIAPDMLGRVFERVMAPGERHQSGTFYTPEHLVHQVVRATIVTALESRVADAAALARLVAGETVATADPRTLGRSLRALRILDPAVGSGAFLLGALDILTDTHAALLTRAGARARLRRRVLRENLFGVDRSPVAVRLAELRLWLAVVADDPTDDVLAVAPLPNLDGVVRQGDSLLDPLGAARTLALPLGIPAAAARTVHHARDAVFEGRGATRTVAERRLREAECTLARSMTEQAEGRVRTALRELAGIARGRDLFGERTGLTESQERRRRTLRRHLRTLRAARRRLDEGTVPFFSFEIHRPDVIAAGGFDIVIGNPPWVRAERLEPGLKAVLKERFAWWGTGPATEGFGHLPDLAIAFLERALELTAQDGAVGFLVPSKLVSAGYGARARSALVRETEIAYLHRVPDREAAQFGAVTYPLVLVARKGRPRSGHRVRLAFGEPGSVSQESLGEADPWLLLPERFQAALGRFFESGVPLATVAPPALGVKTGADDLLTGRVRHAGPRTSCVRLGAVDVEIENEVLRPAVRGRDIRAFDAAAAMVLLWGYDRRGRAQHRLPPLAARYVREHADALRRRSDYRDGPLWAVFRIRAAVTPWRVVWADIARRPAAVVLDATAAARAVPLNSCYVAPAADKRTALAACAVLNSTFARAAAAATADEARGGYRRINARVAGRLPVPRRAAAARLAALSARFHLERRCDQNVLDRAVADALALDRDVRTALLELAGDPR